MTYSRFSCRRGRPRASSDESGADYGTPELVFKRAHGLTSEALDLCRERGIIDGRQHWAGIHLRWLYTLRYGAPDVTALDLLRVHGLHNDVAIDSVWRSDREAEYEQAVQLLLARQCFEVTSDVCIFNCRVAFLRLDKWQRAYDNSSLRGQLERQMQQLQNGLDVLVRLWQRQAPKPSVQPIS